MRRAAAAVGESRVRSAGKATVGEHAGRVWLWSCVALTVCSLIAAVELAPPAGAKPMAALSWLLFTGSSVHVASTLWLFTVPEVRAYGREHPARCLWIPLALIAFGAAAAAAVPPATFAWLLLPYFGWQLFHYGKQNVGMAALAASAQRIRPVSSAERRPLLWTSCAAIAAVIARPGLLGLPPHLGSWSLGPGGHLAVLAPAVHVATAAAFAGAVAAGVAALARRPRAERPAGFAAAYLTSLLFPLPVLVFASPYAAIGGMTVAHGAQYLLLVTLVAAGTGTRQARYSRPVSLALLANIALIGGIALSTASHLHDSGSAGRALFGAYLGAVMGHFVIDAGLWRVRDPAARRFVAARLPYLVPAGTAGAGPRGESPALPADPSSADIRCVA
jgi:hypothetical protein